MAHADHGGPNIGEIEIDHPGRQDDVADALHCLSQNVVGHAERVGDASAARREGKQTIVGNRDQSIDAASQIAQTQLGLAHSLGALEFERLRDHRDGQCIQFFG